MGNLTTKERRFLSAVASLGYCNPFLPDRIPIEKSALGAEFESSGPVWSVSVIDPETPRPNLVAIHRKLGPVLETVREQFSSASELDEEDLRIYEESVHYFLYGRYDKQFRSATVKCSFYADFLGEWNHFCRIPAKQWTSELNPAHVFACYRQIERAFQLIFDNIVGHSMPGAELRASIWQSIFTHDMRRYRRTMYRKMSEFPTLITGPSGTGKEVIARAIAGARYVPFDASRMQFTTPPGESFLPINIAALSPTLIESELFGHRRGSFTGAVGDRKGWLENCPPTGAVFLDELGELDHSIQVKLLRVIETRRFSPVGDTANRTFQGKLIAATNRDLGHEIREGRFREDLYYRMCADLIRTPSLEEHIRDTPGVLDDLLHYMTVRTVGAEAEDCLPEVREWMAKHLPKGYTWPGNYRELEQCVRNVIIRKSYRPLAETGRAGDDQLAREFRNGMMTADELLCRYAAHVYQLTGSYEEAARRMGVDRRTVKARIDQFLKNPQAVVPA
jgi:transcriptional regulator with AAA-type ATPase domain